MNRADPVLMGFHISKTKRCAAGLARKTAAIESKLKG
jgi:hypothetical protein